jgi:PHD/YefM family antitoxin component YafN of YafNO toxin-antitoxin module
MSIQTISSTDFRSNFSQTLGSIKNDNIVVIKRRGLPAAGLIDLDSLEDLLAASNPQYKADIARARLQIANDQTLSFDDVFGNL